MAGNEYESKAAGSATQRILHRPAKSPEVARRDCPPLSGCRREEKRIAKGPEVGALRDGYRIVTPSAEEDGNLGGEVLIQKEPHISA